MSTLLNLSKPRGLQLSGCVGREIFSVQRKQNQTKENGGACGQTRFRPKLSISPPLFVSSLQSSVSLFYVSVTALNKSAMWKISVCCDLALGSAREARGGRGGGESFAEL